MQLDEHTSLRTETTYFGIAVLYSRLVAIHVNNITLMVEESKSEAQGRVYTLGSMHQYCCST